MNVSPEYDAYDAKMNAAEAIDQELRPLNKTTLFDALSAADLTKVVVSFDGCGDSGQIECIDGFGPEDSESTIPETIIEYREAMFGDGSVAVKRMPVSEILEEFAYALLSETHDGWEIDDGAFGEFTFDVGTQTITLDFNERFTESTNHQHQF